MPNTLDIKWLKDAESVKFFPITHMHAVRDDDGNNIESILGTKQNYIEDLATIRSGAALGATSIQSHQDISGKANVSDVYAKTATYSKAEIDNLIVPVSTTVTVVNSLPASGTANTIYRVPGTNSYSDYGWDGSQFVKLAEYTNSEDGGYYYD